MIIMRQDSAILYAENEKNSTILKNTVIHGSMHQMIKQQNGNFINHDYELIHSMDLQ